MKYVPLARTGIFVSELCLGATAFGRKTGETDAVAIMDRAIEAGINFFDATGAEEIAGRWIGPHRDQIILAASVSSDAAGVAASVEQNLERLQTNWIDLLYLVQYAGIEQSLDAVAALVRQGKLMHCGATGFAAWRTMKAMAMAGVPIVCIRTEYSILQRDAEIEILPHAQSEGLAVFPRNPLVQDDKRIPTAQRFLDYAKQKDLPPSALAIAWAAANPAVTAPILGARHLNQLKDALQFLDINLSPEDRERITALSAEPPAT